jgi:hypothetical protein
MYDQSRSFTVTLPLTRPDVDRWAGLRATSLTIEIPAGAKPDLSKLEEMEGIRHLQIGGTSRAHVALVDVLPTLPRLESLAVNLSNYSIGALTPALRDVRLAPYRRRSVDLSGGELRSLWLDGLHGLVDLHCLEGASMARLVLQHAPALGSLDGIPPQVASLRVDFAPRLEDLDALTGNRVRSLELYRCGNVALPEGIEASIEELMLNECGTVPSLSVVKDAAMLKRLEFYGSTVIADGRVRFLGDLAGLRDVRFQNRTAYDATREEIWERLSAPPSRGPSE